VTTKLLFVCSRNRIRSLTAERLFAGVAGYQARSAGTSPQARITLTAGHIGWADVILVMEARHRDIVRARFGRELGDKPLVCLQIPDLYEPMEQALVELLHDQLAVLAGIDLSAS
jgi:predicted protein tyrosine phosphatase